jgi:hypothetical protein
MHMTKQRAFSIGIIFIVIMLVGISCQTAAEPTNAFAEPATPPPGLPDSARFNPDTGEYYNSSVVYWDPVRRMYLPVSQTPKTSVSHGRSATLSKDEWVAQHENSSDVVDIAIVNFYHACMELAKQPLL